ncbi:MAG: hypothetical protein IJ735_07425 [Clostridia bacterium]|nr:hypothetical protein [Clostridia bacterium]
MTEKTNENVDVMEKTETKARSAEDNSSRSKKSAAKSCEAESGNTSDIRKEKQKEKEEAQRLSRPRSGRKNEEARKVLTDNASNEKDAPDKAELQEVYKNAILGMQSVEDLRPLSTDRGFRNLLLKQYGRYAAVAKDVEIYAADRGIELDDPSLFAKGMMKMTTMFNTIKDKSNSKLAEIMVQGINMGIISVTKVINRLSDEHRTNEYADRMLNLMQQNLNEMKLFL